jgi:hypothetical protein
MANVLMPVMVVPDRGLKRQSLAHFVDKQEKHRGSRQRGERIRRVASRRLSKIVLFGDCLAGTAKLSRKVPQLRQTVPHRQYRLGVVDVNARSKCESRDGCGEHIHKANCRMIDHQMSAALRAILALAELRYLKHHEMFRTRFDPHGVRLPEAEGVHGPAGPRTTRPAVTIAHGLR